MAAGNKQLGGGRGEGGGGGGVRHGAAGECSRRRPTYVWLQTVKFLASPPNPAPLHPNLCSGRCSSAKLLGVIPADPSLTPLPVQRLLRQCDVARVLGAGHDIDRQRGGQLRNHHVHVPARRREGGRRGGAASSVPTVHPLTVSAMAAATVMTITVAATVAVRGRRPSAPHSLDGVQRCGRQA